MERAIPEWVDDYVGIPYLAGGRTHFGADCIGLIQLIAREQLGIEWPQYEGAHWHRRQKKNVIGRDADVYASQFRMLGLGEEERLGDAIGLRVLGHTFHCGMVLSPGWMIHSHEGAGSAIENYRSMMWTNRITGFYRYEKDELHAAG